MDGLTALQVGEQAQGEEEEGLEVEHAARRGYLAKD